MTQEKNPVGVISSVDGTDIQDIDREDRKEWVESLMQDIETELEAVIETGIDTASKQYNEVTFYVLVEGENCLDGYDLQINPKSFSKRLHHIVNTDKYANINMFDPTIESPTKTQKSVYDQQYYRVTVQYP